MADRVIGDRVEKTPRRELDRTNLDAVRVGGVLTDARAPVRNGGVVQRSQAAAVPASNFIERYPTPIKVTGSGGTDGNGNDLYNVAELDGVGNATGITRANVPNLGRPAAALSVDDQAEMGYSPESASFFFSEAS